MPNFRTYLMLGYKPGYTLAGTNSPTSFDVIHRAMGHSVSTVNRVILISRSA